MAKVAIPTRTVKCKDGSTDVYVELNSNSNADDKVQAFVDCFKGVAETARDICYGLPIKFILAQWGGESGWGSSRLQQSNQNWVNMMYASASNPVGNIGKGENGWAKFEGRGKFANGYAHFFINNSRYSDLIYYLKNCQNNGASPNINTCARHIADAGFGGANHDQYYNELLAYISTLENRSDIDTGGSVTYEEIPISANLTIQGTSVYVRTEPSTNSGHVKTLNTGDQIVADGRTLISGEPWFHFNDGWVNGRFVQGWVKDYKDNNRWWYVEKGYNYPTSMWKTIAGKDYCFGPDGYLFVECYIKSEVNSTYYWVDDDGVYMSQYDTTTPDGNYRVVENYKTENGYQG